MKIAAVAVLVLLLVGCSKETQRRRDVYFRNGAVSYMQDDRTGICFARWNNGGGVIVPCSPAVLAAIKDRL